MFLRILLTLMVASAVGAGLTLSGCERGGPSVRAEQDETSYRRGDSLMREGRHDEALIAYSRVLEERRDAPESHLAMGQIYLDHMKDPISAIYHFNQFLILKPDSEKSTLVRNLIDAAKKEFARTLPAEPFGDRFDRLDLLDKVEELRAENLDLKRQLAAAQSESQRAAALANQRAAALQATRTAAANQPPPQPQQNAVAAAPQPQLNLPATYTVEGGDTLSIISRKLYGTSSRWRDIFEANRDVLPNSDALKVGQVLKVPR